VPSVCYLTVCCISYGLLMVEQFVGGTSTDFFLQVPLDGRSLACQRMERMFDVDLKGEEQS